MGLNNVGWIVLGISIPLIFIGFFLFRKFIIIYKEYKDNVLELKKYEIDSKRYEVNMQLYNQDGINETELLDAFIAECFEEYKLMNLIPSKPNTPIYISDDEEEKIRKDLADIVSNRISSIFVERLSLRYNPKFIGDIIGNKIYLIVMEYVISVRQTNSDIRNSLPNETVFKIEDV